MDIELIVGCGRVVRFEMPGNVGNHGLLPSPEIQHGFQQGRSLIVQHIIVPSAFNQFREQNQQMAGWILFLQLIHLIDDGPEDAPCWGLELDEFRLRFTCLL